jgi:hypothetical protein
LDADGCRVAQAALSSHSNNVISPSSAQRKDGFDRLGGSLRSGE